MTALKQFERLEATGLWRPDPDTQRRDVIVSLGEATLTISTAADQALAHWSLAAIARAPGRGTPAIYHPEGDPSETLEIDAPEMIEAIDRLRQAVRKARPKTGRLRWIGAAVSAALVGGLAVFWLPEALVAHAMRVVPDVTRTEIGAAVQDRMGRIAGRACRTGAAEDGLRALADRTGAAALDVMPGGVRSTLTLPGGRILMNRTLVEDFETPDVAAGYILVEQIRSAGRAPLRDVLEHGGLWASVTLLTTGHMPERALDRYAEAALRKDSAPVDPAAALQAFAAARIASSPYAYAVDVSGEASLPLIEGDPMRGQGAAPIMSDSAWLRLQSICGA
ncbi:MAG: hypothetical protein AAF218_04950 [Pseudomonadota bacterium]